MSKEKFEEYRDELAEKLKEKRSSDSENPGKAHAKAQGHLEAKKEAPQYKEAKNSHIIERDDKIFNKHGFEWLKEFSEDPSIVDEFLEAQKELIDAGLEETSSEYNRPHMTTDNWGRIQHHSYDINYEVESFFDDSDYRRAQKEFDPEGRSNKFIFDISAVRKEINRIVERREQALSKLTETINYDKLREKYPEANPPRISQLLREAETVNYTQDGYAKRNENFKNFIEKFRKPPEVIEQEGKSRKEQKEKEPEMEKPESIMNIEWEFVDGIKDLPSAVAEAVKKGTESDNNIPEFKVEGYRKFEREDGITEYEIRGARKQDILSKERNVFGHQHKEGESQLPISIRVEVDKDGSVIHSEIHY